MNSRALKYIIPLAVGIFAGLFFIASNIETVKINGMSMSPLLKDGDLISTFSNFKKPQRFGVYIIDHHFIPETPNRKILGNYIKRVVGVPGDTLIFDRFNGELVAINDTSTSIAGSLDNKEVLSINDIKIKKSFQAKPYRFVYKSFQSNIYNVSEDFAKTNNSFNETLFKYDWLSQQKGYQDTRNLIRVTIPEKQYFIMSDNRIVGIDSRHFGLIPEKAFIAKYLRKEST